MAAERRDEDARELRLEGLGLIVTGGVLLVLLIGAFYLGRWVERQAHPAGTLATADALSGRSATVPGGGPATVEVDGGSDIFDSAGATDAEPSRQAIRDEPAAADGGQAATPQAPSSATDGGFFVQVFAGRDRASAETLVNELRRDGYGVKVVSENDGGGSVFKVRVGGYATRGEADAAAATLEKAGYSTWVTSES